MTTWTLTWSHTWTLCRKIFTLRRETKRLPVVIWTIREGVRLPARRALCRTANTFQIFFGNIPKTEKAADLLCGLPVGYLPGVSSS